MPYPVFLGLFKTGRHPPSKVSHDCMVTKGHKGNATDNRNSDYRIQLCYSKVYPTRCPTSYRIRVLAAPLLGRSYLWPSTDAFQWLCIVKMSPLTGLYASRQIFLHSPVTQFMVLTSPVDPRSMYALLEVLSRVISVHAHSCQ